MCLATCSGHQPSSSRCCPASTGGKSVYPATYSRHQSTTADPRFHHHRCGHLSSVRSPGVLSGGGRHGQQSIPQGQLINFPGVSATLRLLYWSTPLTAATAVPVCSFCHRPHPCSPGHQGHQATHVGPLGVDRHVYRHHPLVKGLPILPVGQGDPPTSRCRPADAHPSQAVLPHPSGPGGPPPEIQRGF